MKFIFCLAGIFGRASVDDPNIEHDAALIIEDENKTVRLSVGLYRDAELSKPYYPYCARVLTKEKMIWLRDELTRLIDETNGDVEC